MKWENWQIEQRESDLWTYCSINVQSIANWSEKCQVLKPKICNFSFTFFISFFYCSCFGFTNLATAAETQLLCSFFLFLFCASSVCFPSSAHRWCAVCGSRAFHSWVSRVRWELSYIARPLPEREKLPQSQWYLLYSAGLGYCLGAGLAQPVDTTTAPYSCGR